MAGRERNRASPGQGGAGPTRRPATLVRLLVPLLVALVACGCASDASVDPEATRIPYSEFRAQLEMGNVTRVVAQGSEIRGDLASPARTASAADGSSVEYTRFVTRRPPFDDPELYQLLRQRNVQVEVLESTDLSGAWTVLLNLLPILLLLAVGFAFARSVRGQSHSLTDFGRSGAKLYRKEPSTAVTFDDVAGAEGAKAELQEVIEFLRNPAKFHRLGAGMPKGILLVGAPGTGKTLLARAVAGEAGVPFYSITGSDFMEMFVGVGASRVRDLFAEAKRTQPSIVFVDELDSIGRLRGAGIGGGHDEREQTLNQLLSELDGFERNEGVIVLAATNRPDILDPALLRPGRFDRRVTVDLPTTSQRVAILSVHSRNKPLAPDVDLEELARGTPGFSGADLENLLNEAALNAAREGKAAIDRADVEDARDKVLMGLRREGMAIGDEEKRLLAYHEAGHALVAVRLPKADPIHKVTIVPRGRAMGITQQLPEGEVHVYQQDYMADRLAVLLAGRASETLVFGTKTSGAEADLREATMIAHRMVSSWGMGRDLGPVSFDAESGTVFLGEDLGRPRPYSEQTANVIDREVQYLLGQSLDRARAILERDRSALDAIAAALAEKEELAGEEVRQIVLEAGLPGS
ncbi:MAG: ATP-dependent zinc metalloprotease FtsH, partial [Anaerolineae bacterium]|nr:ATP-dependent zinc metalloprotease FtsH [Anaerolineae bacterium]